MLTLGKPLLLFSEKYFEIYKDKKKYLIFGFMSVGFNYKYSFKAQKSLWRIHVRNKKDIFFTRSLKSPKSTLCKRFK